MIMNMTEPQNQARRIEIGDALIQGYRKAKRFDVHDLSVAASIPIAQANSTTVLGNIHGDFVDPWVDKKPRRLDTIRFSDNGQAVVTGSMGSECLFTVQNLLSGSKTAISSMEIQNVQTGSSGTSQSAISLRGYPVKKYGVGEILFASNSSQMVIHASNNNFDHSLRHLSLSDARYVRYYRAHRDYVTSMTSSVSLPRQFASASMDGTIRFWDDRTSACNGKISLQHLGVKTSIAIDTSGTCLAVCSGVDPVHCMLDATSPDATAMICIELFDIRMYDAGPFLACVSQCDSDTIRKVMDPSQHTAILKETQAPPKSATQSSSRKPAVSVDALYILPDNKSMLLGYSTCTVSSPGISTPEASKYPNPYPNRTRKQHLCLLDGFTLDRIHSFECPDTDTTLIVSGCHYTPDGQYVSCGSTSGFVHIWKASTGRHVYSLDAHKNEVRSTQFHPSHNLLASGSEELTLWLSVSGN